MSEGDVARDSYAQRRNRVGDRAIAAIAGRQHGVVALRQLLELGLSTDQVRYRVRIGRLHPVHRGVYAVGHRDLSRYGRWMAATRIAPEAALSHRSAGALWRMTGASDETHVTAARKLRPRHGLTFHRRDLSPDERTTRYGIPVTSVARTLLDIAADGGYIPFERALREATFLCLDDPLGLPRLIARHAGQPGTAIVGRALHDGAYRKRTRSGLEDLYLEFARDRGLPLPETNVIVTVGGRDYEVDALYRRERLIVELDGGRAHGSPPRREEDLERDGNLQAHGFSVHRVTGRRIERDSDGLERQLRRALDLQLAA